WQGRGVRRGWFRSIFLIILPLWLAGGAAFPIVLLWRLPPLRWGALGGAGCLRSGSPLARLVVVSTAYCFSPVWPFSPAGCAVAFFLNTSSYYGEIYRAGIESVGQGQWDAARSTGLQGYQTLAYVVLPQAVRNVLPDLVSNTVEVVKLTSIASVVALPELLYS